MCMRRFFIGCVSIMAATLVCVGAAAQETVAVSAVEEVWPLSKEAAPGRRVSVDVVTENGYSAFDPILFECQIESAFSYEKTLIELEIYDASGALVSETSIVMDLYKGANACRFTWNADDLPTGLYQALFEVNYTKEETPARLVLNVKKISDTQLRQDTARVITRLRELGERMAPLRESGQAPHLLARWRIAGEFGKRAEADLAAGSWRAADAKLGYLEKAAASIEAGLAFGGLTPELLEAVPEADLAALEFRDGAIFAQDRPVYLFGRVLPGPRPADIEQLHHFGLNFAAFAISPAVTLEDGVREAPFKQSYSALFEAARENNISVTVQLAPHDPGVWVFDAWPELADQGYINLGHPGVAQTLARHLAILAPFLESQPMVNAVSLAYNPVFHFDGEDVRRAFIAYVQERFPDRQQLNRIWHAHLADFDDITIWDDTAPEYSYQNRRAYQYEWQTFHRGLATEFVWRIRERARGLAQGLPVMITLPDTPFESGESRQGVDRERVLAMMDISGCSVTTDPVDSYYALSYPRLSAFYTLLRSLQPGKPVFALDKRVVLGPELDADFAYRYVFSAIWEGVLSGMNAVALSPDTPIFERPEALEAFVTAHIGINRLAPIVHAFQQEPPDVVILFSDTSKIFNDGNPHLKSAWYAYEGSSFGGYNLHFVTEDQCIAGALDNIKVLVLPETPALRDETFDAIAAFSERGGTIARVGTPIPYDERGVSRGDVIRNTGNTVLVRGKNLPTEYLHAMDAAMVHGALPRIPRPVNAFGHPLEGVKTRYLTLDGEHYLYVINLCKEPIECHLVANMHSGRDLIQGRSVRFPMVLDTLDPMLIHLDQPVITQALE
jgi:hypothetical protein